MISRLFHCLLQYLIVSSAALQLLSLSACHTQRVFSGSSNLDEYLHTEALSSCSSSPDWKTRMWSITTITQEFWVLVRGYPSLNVIYDWLVKPSSETHLTLVQRTQRGELISADWRAVRGCGGTWKGLSDYSGGGEWECSTFPSWRAEVQK